jgi:hypothetical protein
MVVRRREGSVLPVWPGTATVRLFLPT